MAGQVIFIGTFHYTAMRLELLNRATNKLLHSNTLIVYSKFVTERRMTSHLSMTPAHLTPPLHTVLQTDRTPRHKVFDLHAHVTAHVSYLQHI